MDLHIGRWLMNFRLRKLDLKKPFQSGEEAEIKEANVIASNNPGELHCKPVIDLDVPCQLYTSTNGNSHLLIDFPLTIAQYDKLLRVLVEIGIYQEGCYEQFKKMGFTAVRAPWVIKHNDELYSK